MPERTAAIRGYNMGLVTAFLDLLIERQEINTNKELASRVYALRDAMHAVAGNPISLRPDESFLHRDAY